MPAAAWADERHLAPLGLTNYWGYNPVGWLAPDPRLAPGGMAEVRAAVAALAEAGIGTILDVVLNHSGEGDEHGPTLSLRGLGDAAWYRTLPGLPARYANETGCGNSLALDRPAVLRLAMDAMRHWVDQAGLAGLRLDLATTLGRRAGGFDPDAPLLQAMRQDPLLSRRGSSPALGVGQAAPPRDSRRLGRMERRFRDGCAASGAAMAAASASSPRAAGRATSSQARGDGVAQLRHRA